MIYAFSDNLENAIAVCTSLVKSEKTSYVILKSETSRYKVTKNSSNYCSSDVVMHVHYEQEEESTYWC